MQPRRENPGIGHSRGEPIGRRSAGQAGDSVVGQFRAEARRAQSNQPVIGLCVLCASALSFSFFLLFLFHFQS
jgi:hypothetical protein